jgi:hypothetical protein
MIMLPGGPVSGRLTHLIMQPAAVKARQLTQMIMLLGQAPPFLVGGLVVVSARRGLWSPPARLAVLAAPPAGAVKGALAFTSPLTAPRTARESTFAECRAGEQVPLKLRPRPLPARLDRTARRVTRGSRGGAFAGWSRRREWRASRLSSQPVPPARAAADTVYSPRPTSA